MCSRTCYCFDDQFSYDEIAHVPFSLSPPIVLCLWIFVPLTHLHLHSIFFSADLDKYRVGINIISCLFLLSCVYLSHFIPSISATYSQPTKNKRCCWWHFSIMHVSLCVLLMCPGMNGYLLWFNEWIGDIWWIISNLEAHTKKHCYRNHRFHLSKQKKMRVYFSISYFLWFYQDFMKPSCLKGRI